MEKSESKSLWRKSVDILLIFLLSFVAISQVFESCTKFIKRQTTQTVSLRDNIDIIFPSLTICDKNGFKNISAMESANMSNFRLMTKSKHFLFWPNNSNQGGIYQFEHYGLFISALSF